jgi:hypothetical protein
MLAFLQNDVSGIARQAAWSASKPGVEDVVLALEANTTAYSGRLGKARELSRRAVASAERAGEKETAAHYETEAALREALLAMRPKRVSGPGRRLGFRRTGMQSMERRWPSPPRGPTKSGRSNNWRIIWPAAFPKTQQFDSSTCPSFAPRSLSAATILQRPSRLFGQPLYTSWRYRVLVPSPLYIRFIYAGKLIWP